MIEGEFNTLIQGLRIPEKRFALAATMFEELWTHRQITEQARADGLKEQIASLEREIDKLVSRIIETETPAVVKAMEKRVGQLEEQKALATERIASCGRPLRSFDESVRTALRFLENPGKLWLSDLPEHRRAVMKLAFQERPAYARNSGFRTPDLALPFKALAGLAEGKIEMARPRRESSNYTIGPEPPIEVSSLIDTLQQWNEHLQRGLSCRA